MSKVLGPDGITMLAQLQVLRAGGSGAKPIPGKWEDLDETARDLERKKVCDFLDDLAKVNFEPRPIGEFKEARAAKKVNREGLANFIEAWIKKQVKFPEHAIKYFPKFEFAEAIAEEVEKNEAAVDTAKKE